MENLITWGEIKDNHVLGYSILGKIWIRLNKEQCFNENSKKVFFF